MREAHAAASAETRAAHSLISQPGAVPTETLLAEAQRLYAEAKGHKRASETHKRRARSAMRRFDAFRKDLEALGIEVVIEKPPMPSKGEHQ